MTMAKPRLAHTLILNLVHTTVCSTFMLYSIILENIILIRLPTLPICMVLQTHSILTKFTRHFFLILVYFDHTPLYGLAWAFMLHLNISLSLHNRFNTTCTTVYPIHALKVQQYSDCLKLLQGVLYTA